MGNDRRASLLHCFVYSLPIRSTAAVEKAANSSTDGMEDDRDDPSWRPDSRNRMFHLCT